MRILVVEDDLILAITLENELIDAGHQVIGPATTAAEGHQLALAHRPDVALLNINLKDGSSGLHGPCLPIWERLPSSSAETCRRRDKAVMPQSAICPSLTSFRCSTEHRDCR